MRSIAVAARELEGPPRGVARWLGEILAGWRQLGRDDDVALYVSQPLPEGLPVGRAEVRITGAGPISGATAWEQLALARALRRDRPRALLCPANSVPLLSPVPTVLVLHDLSFEAHPEWFTRREGYRRRTLARWGARRAHRVVVVSDFTAREVQRRYGVAPERLVVVPNGISEHFQPLADRDRLEATMARHRLAGSEVVLSVGSLFTRRRVEELIRGFAILADARKTAHLVLVGDNRTHPRIDVTALLTSLGIAHRVRWLERVSDDELVELYSLAAVAVYLSDYEGFGLPPLEALACGAPVLASDATALGDNLRGHATLLSRDEHSPQRIAERLRAMLDEPPPRPDRRPAWLSRFSWPAASRAILEQLDDAAR